MGRRHYGASGPDGLLLVDKPAGISSAAVVARVRRVFGGVKAGHTGTLDPFATGLLPLGLGEGTKLSTWLTDNDKTYEGVIRLGVTTDTLDRTGTITNRSEVGTVDEAVLTQMAEALLGETMQVPPEYSAIKRAGRPMYELARRGEAPELDPRPVRIDRIEMKLVEPDGIAVSIDCSKGFYVRSLARDLGEQLGCGAMLESLRRTRVGRFRIEDAVALEELEKSGPAAGRVQTMLEALEHLRCIAIPGGDAESLRLGRQGPLLALAAGKQGERVRLAAGSELVGVASYNGRLWALERVFAAAASSSPPASVRGDCPAGGIVLAAPVSQMEEEERNEANHRD